MNVTLNVTLGSYARGRYRVGNVTLPTVNINFRIHAEPEARVTFLTSRNRT